MFDINKIIEKAYKNNNRINLEEIMYFNLKEDDFEKLFENLNKNNIEIVCEIEPNDSIDFIGSSELSDSVNLYLMEISKIPLLSKEKEKTLFKLYKKGDINARKQLIESNLRLVVAIAKKHSECSKYGVMNILDLIQEGNMGLIKAIENFDENKNYKFSTYAYYWIERDINRSKVFAYRGYRYSIYFQEKLNKIRKFSAQYFTEFCVKPTIEQIAEGLNYSIKEVKDILLKKYETYSLDMPVFDDDNASLKDVIASDVCMEDEIVEKIYLKEVNQQLDEIMKQVLTEREYDIVLLRLGIGIECPKTLAEIGSIYGLTRERIRVIEKNAYIKIRRELNKKSINQKQKKSL